MKPSSVQMVEMRPENRHRGRGCGKRMRPSSQRSLAGGSVQATVTRRPWRGRVVWSCLSNVGVSGTTPVAAAVDDDDNTLLC